MVKTNMALQADSLLSTMFNNGNFNIVATN